ncbi:hypothetical protein [Streptococcus loxodontisalivarius]|uniref:Glycosyltransferase n=1 Tax=Streptococcus loxodontisalivarius TaxID=1349415 RepID=A0ABS2PVL0_9STRE|nr:hypothetical protein [Streptococcus loxodontisalivarius]MBM7643750.1 hypothetical protein [Streptococcus loxodontisalivarius]
MKKIKRISFALLAFTALLMLVACKGSAKIQGTWKAQDPSENNIEVVITDTSISIDGESSEYTQNGIGIVNGIHYYVIKPKDYDNYYSIIFPDSDDDVAIMLQIDDTDEPLQGSMILAMNKSETPDYSDYAEKYMDTSQ